MAYDSTQVNMGVCTIVFNGVDMGLTIGGVVVTYTPTYHDVKVDQFNGLVEKFLVEEKLTAKVPLAQFTLANLNALIAQSTKTAGKISFGSYGSKKASALAHPLVLHPIANAAGDRTQDVIILKAVSTSPAVVSMDNKGEKILEITFEGLVDSNGVDGSMLGIIGDSTQ